MTSPLVRRIEGEAVLEWLRRDAVTSFRYEPNVAGMWMLILGGFFGFLAGALVWWFADIQELLTKAIVLVFFFAGGWLWWRQVWWFRFLVKTYVAVAEDEILVGTGKDAFAIPREHLTRDAVKVDDMQRGRLTMALPLRLTGFSYDIYLFGPFVKLKNLQAFTGLLIQQFYDPDELAAIEDDDPVEPRADYMPDDADLEEAALLAAEAHGKKRLPMRAPRKPKPGLETQEIFGSALEPATEVRGKEEDE